MNPEFLQAKGRLADAQSRLHNLNLKAANLLVTLRGKLDPYADSITELDTEAAKAAMDDLHDTVLQARELQTLIKRIKTDFNV